jgi:hypothetical protein
MKHLNTNSYCAVNLGKQPVPANWLHNSAASFASIRGTIDLEQVGVFE